MRATRGLVLSAFCGWILAGMPAAANAQIYDAARRLLDFAPDATARSPRLLGMGRLALASDIHNGINLWDFAGNPVGIYEADTASTFDLRPSTFSADARHTPIGGTRERGNLAGRELRMGFEAFKRSENSVYGFYGDVADLRSDRPFGDGEVLRGHLDEPRLVGVLNGRLPYFQSERMRYELHASYSSENTADEYRTFFSNSQGDYLGHESLLLRPPNFFDPDEFRVSSIGGGAALSYRVAPWMTAAFGGDATSSRIEGENSDPIHNTGTGEDRPYYGARLSMIGRFGRALEYGLDGRTWTSSSEERYVFTLKAGQNQDPFTGRGKMLDRDEDGKEGRARLRWTLGRLELDAGASNWRRTLDVLPTAPGEPGAYNYFLDIAANRLGADSLAMPDSIQRSHSKDKGWDLAYGATWRLPRGKGLVGLEYHLAEQTAEDLVYAGPTPFTDTLSFAGRGPDRRTWDVRGGLEYACSPAFMGRLGYIRRSDDRDQLTGRNEFLSNSMTAGFGIKPLGATWSLDLGWAIEWISPDFADPTEPKESRQQLAAQIRWVF